ncbi:MAG TPA: hypothetical protein VGM06_06565 [Polyangiaceae bacterium]|jgi:hypothetical protein
MFFRSAVVLSCAFAATSLVAQDAHAATIDKESFKGSQISTTFASTTAITCADGSAGSVSASGFLSGSDSVTKETGTPKTTSNGIFVEIDTYSNSCTGASLSFGDGGIADGYAPPNKKLASGGLEGVASVQDFSTGLSISVDVALVIEGTGPITSEKSHSRTKTVQSPGGPVTITITRSASSSRDGVVSGTITVDGVALDAQFSSTTLSSNASTEITITKK